MGNIYFDSKINNKILLNNDTYELVLEEDLVVDAFEFISGGTYITGQEAQTSGSIILNRNEYAYVGYDDIDNYKVWLNIIKCDDIDSATPQFTYSTKNIIQTTIELKSAAATKIVGSTDKMLFSYYGSDGDMHSSVYTISNLSYTGGTEYTSTPPSDVRRTLLLTYLGNNKYVLYGRDETSSIGTHYQVVITHNPVDDSLTYSSWAGNGLGDMGNTHIVRINDTSWLTRNASTTLSYGVNTLSGTTITPASVWYQVSSDNPQVDTNSDHTYIMSSGSTYLGVTQFGGVRSYFKIDGTVISDITWESVTDETSGTGVYINESSNEAIFTGSDGESEDLLMIRKPVSYSGFGSTIELKYYTGKLTTPTGLGVNGSFEIRSGMDRYEDIIFWCSYEAFGIFKNNLT